MADLTPQDDKQDQITESIFSEQEFDLQVYNKHIRQARNAIFTAAGVLALSLIVLLVQYQDSYEYVWIDIALWGGFILGFILLGFWTKKKPYYAITAAIILYVIFIAINAVIDISTIYKGLIFKVIVFVFLFKGVNQAKEAQAQMEEMGR